MLMSLNFIFYSLYNVQIADAGKYSCSATNEAGTVSDTAEITVEGLKVYFVTFK